MSNKVLTCHEVVFLNFTGGLWSLIYYAGLSAGFWVAGSTQKVGGWGLRGVAKWLDMMHTVHRLGRV